MKNIFSGIGLILCILIQYTTNAQNLPKLYPTTGSLIDRNPESENVYNQRMKMCQQFWANHSRDMDTSNLTPREKILFHTCDIGETDAGYWDVMGAGCSWYCGGGQDTNTASSHLPSSVQGTYVAGNIHDLNYKTAWIEGAPGYGIGEYITYHFPPENPRITEIIVVNGYVKSYALWQRNSRVKKMKMYVNENPVAILYLEDSRKEQHFRFAPIGNGNRTNIENLMTQPWWTMKFEILDVYPGSRYDHTAITEIYFDGIDVH